MQYKVKVISIYFKILWVKCSVDCVTSKTQNNRINEIKQDQNDRKIIAVAQEIF